MSSTGAIIRRIAFTAVTLLAATLSAGPQAIAAPPAGTDDSEAYFRTPDGVRLHADVLCPADAASTECLKRARSESTPVLMEIGPYNAHSMDTPADPHTDPPPPTEQPLMQLAIQHDLWKRGYTVIEVDDRGFGGSTGSWDAWGPGTALDVYTSVKWAASQPWSDGKVALVGGSASGATGAEALATDPPGLAAVAPFSPIVSSYGNAFTNGVRTERGPMDLLYPCCYGGLEPGFPYDDPQYQENFALRHTDLAWARAYRHELLDPDPGTPFWQARDWTAKAARSTVPVFGGEGFLEWENVALDQGISLYSRLRNLQGAWLGQFPHEPFYVEDPSITGTAGAGDQLVSFLDHALLGTPASDAPPVVVQEAPDLKWRQEQRWPPADADSFSIPLKPGGYTDHGGNVAGDSVEGALPGTMPAEQAPVKGCELSTPAGPTPDPRCGTWTFTQPLPYEIHMAGFPTVRVTARGSSSAHLIALMYDVAPDGSAYLISRAASLLANGQLSIRMQPQDWRIAPGHRIALLLCGADDSWYAPNPAGTTVTVTSGSLAIPALAYQRTMFLNQAPGQRWSEIKHPIQLDQTTITTNTEQAPLPPPMQPQP